MPGKRGDSRWKRHSRGARRSRKAGRTGTCTGFRGEIKRDERLKDSGALEGFDFLGDLWSLEPRTAFYDWLYVRAVSQHPELAAEATRYAAFSDIEFNPKKSVNCQASSVALFVSLLERDLLDRALSSKDAFLELVGGVRSPGKPFLA